MLPRLLMTHVAMQFETPMKIRADVQSFGNASHDYHVTYEREDGGVIPLAQIRFQHGTLNENGPNGVTNEALIAIVIDRLQGFQTSAFASRFNADALTHLEYALAALKQRTIDRAQRGVEGTHQA